MALEFVEFGADGETYEARLNTPEDGDADVCVVVVPGAGHGPFGDIFDITAYELAGAGVATLRYETWETTEDIDAKTLDGLHRELADAVAFVDDHGYDRVFVLAKSFGGRIAFTGLPDAVERILGWAPAVDVAEESNLDAVSDTPMGEFDALQVAASDLADVDVPVRLLYGTDDHFYPEPAQSLADALDAEFVELDGETHSFNEHRPTVVAETLDYLVPDA
jgi:pimeloyl-ACP methyl ester carboxylesterase